MIGGFERYYQIVRCFRDEDLRADRALDFTQLDLEMSFVELDDVLELNERLLASVLGEVGIEVPLPLRRIPFDEAMARYGSDKPDLRFGLEIEDVTEVFRGSEFNAFRGAIEGGGVIRALNAGARELSRAELDGLVAAAQDLGAKGLVWAFREGDGWRSPVAKFLSAEEIGSVNAALEAGEGDLVLLVADAPAMVARVLGELRLRMAKRFDLIPEGAHELCWIVDWPLFEYTETENRWTAMHHPFTAPDGAIDPERPGEARALAYDVAWNGAEIGGGSIRISSPEVQQQAFEAIGISPEEAQSRFGFLLEALRYGAPPHGGIAYGIDRIAALAHGVDSIRDVIAFPKAASGSDPLTGAPAAVAEAQLRELGIQLRGGGQAP